MAIKALSGLIWITSPVSGVADSIRRGLIKTILPPRCLIALSLAIGSDTCISDICEIAGLQPMLKSNRYAVNPESDAP
jgi:hypothetical protein